MEEGYPKSGFPPPIWSSMSRLMLVWDVVSNALVTSTFTKKKGPPQFRAIRMILRMAKSISTDRRPLEHHCKRQTGDSRCCVRRRTNWAAHFWDEHRHSFFKKLWEGTL